MAIVYRAHHASTDRQVALKVITQTAAADPTITERFRREARLIARLEHPNILPIYDFDGTHQPPYIVMRLLDGGTLKDLLNQGPLTVQETLALLRQAALGLDYAHDQGILHRDIKPSNIMVDQQGHVFVADFGLARIILEADAVPDGITDFGSTIGTPEYMSPEQGLGENLDAQADLYALGVTLFEMLTGQLPYTANSATALVLKHVRDPIPSAQAINPQLPAALDKLFQKALSKQPAERFTSATGLINAAAAALSVNLDSSAHVSISAVRRLQGTHKAATAISTEERHKLVSALALDAFDYHVLVDETQGREAAKTAVDALWTRTRQIVERHGGTVQEQNDTSLIALWGMRRSHEDDPQHAIRAANDTFDWLRRNLNGSLSGEPIPLRAGIHTGEALVIPKAEGGLQASGAALTMATRLAKQAEGSIVFSHDTYRTVRGVFDVAPQSPMPMRGRKEPLELYRLNGVKPRAFRIVERGVEGVETRMIGREGELKRMQHDYYTVFEDRQSQAITIMGEAGLGKSRLMYDFMNWVELRPEIWRIFRGRSTPDMRQRPYALLRDTLVHRFEILDNDPPPVVLKKLEHGMNELVPDTPPDHPRLIGQLAGFELDDATSAPGWKDRAQDAIFAFFEALTAREEVLMQFEDIHHADDATLDLLTTLVQQRDQPLLVMFASRPSLLKRRPNWAGERDLHRCIELEPLDRHDSRALVREMLQKMEDIPRLLRDLLVERAEGNPYFMEELVKMLIEARVIQKGDTWTVAADRLQELPVPGTLAGLLQTRIDSLLQPERLVLQRAAVIGRIFWSSAVEALAEADGVNLSGVSQILATLMEREFIFLRETTALAGSREYVFRQAMLREVLYDGLVERQRTAYHSAAAAWLAEASTDRAAEYHTQIAEHFEAAGERARAAQVLGRLGSQLIHMGALEEADDMLTRAHALVSVETAPAEYARVALLRGELYGVRGAYEEAREQLKAALAWGREQREPAVIMGALSHLGRVALWQGDREYARTLFTEALVFARALGDQTMAAFILRQLGNNALNSARYETALKYLNESLELYRKLKDQTGEAAVLNSLARNYQYLNQVEEALAFYNRALDIARLQNDRTLSAIITDNIGLCYADMGDHESALLYAETATEIGRTVGSDWILSMTLSNIAAAQMMLGRPTAYSALLMALRQCRQTGSIPDLLANLPVLALWYARHDKITQGLELIGLVLAHPSKTGGVKTMAERARAQLQPLLPADDADAALVRGALLDLGVTIDALLSA